MIERLLNRPELRERPPVLVDVGASGTIHPNWRPFAKYAICVAFDADERDFHATEESGKFRTLHVFNCIVSDQSAEASDFYLTRSPHCSSLLRPYPEGLKDTAWAERFEVERVVKLRTRALGSVLDELRLDRVDWFKTDSQGLDLRLFRNLGEERLNRVLVAEFEPGLIDAYHGEDKLHALLAYLESTRRFWLSDFVVKGSSHISPALLRQLSPDPKVQKLLLFSLKSSPGWGELTYFNRLEDHDVSLRDRLLAYVFAVVEGQYGFALQLALDGQQRYHNDPDFGAMVDFARKKLWGRVVKIGFWPAVKTKIRQLLNQP
jgi:hypothetical protein